MDSGFLSYFGQCFCHSLLIVLMLKKHTTLGGLRYYRGVCKLFLTGSCLGFGKKVKMSKGLLETIRVKSG